jgi:hypothetical protein
MNCLQSAVYLPLTQVAELLGMSEFTIYRMAHKRQIPCLLIGGFRNKGSLTCSYAHLSCCPEFILARNVPASPPGDSASPGIPLTAGIGAAPRTGGKRPQWTEKGIQALRLVHHDGTVCIGLRTVCGPASQRPWNQYRRRIGECESNCGHLPAHAVEIPSVQQGCVTLNEG